MIKVYEGIKRNKERTALAETAYFSNLDDALKFCGLSKKDVLDTPILNMVITSIEPDNYIQYIEVWECSEYQKPSSRIDRALSAIVNDDDRNFIASLLPPHEL